MSHKTDDVRIKNIKELLPPIAHTYELPATEAVTDLIFQTRAAISAILQGQDDRLLCIVGPCSIHDEKSALEYAQRLAVLRATHAQELLIVMRVYFEKPRTTVGWKGLINDPYLNESYNINEGLRTARRLLLDLNKLGMPAGSEFLDMITPQYFADLISWGAIGARTTESQVHREMASGLSCPVGFKNGTDGNLKIAADAIRAAKEPHHFLSVTKSGLSAIVETAGNSDCHLILRGGKAPNYKAADVLDAAQLLTSVKLPAKVMVDFSHANSSKEYLRQKEVSTDVAQQIASGNQALFGVMIESHLVAGRQDLQVGQALTYGQSITDACVGWADTELMLAELATAVSARRALK